MRFDIFGINILSSAMGAALIYYFCYSNYAVKKSTSRIIAFICFFGIFNGIISTFMLQSGDLANIIKPIVLLVVSIIVNKLILDIKIYQTLIAYFIYTICMGIGNSIIPLFINLSSQTFTTGNMLANPSYLLYINIVSNFIAYIIIFTIKPLRNFVSKSLVQKATLPILFITFLILTANFGMHFYVKIFNLAAFIIISALSILYCIYVVIVSSKLIKNETAKQEIEQQKFYNESLNSTIFNLRRFKHDWNNNLTVINSMLTMNKMCELKQYLSEIMQQSTEGIDIAIYNIKNAGLFGIISSMLNHSKDMGVTVDFTVTGEVENIPGIKISELCEVIGIFIDNAIEEALKSDKSIKLTIFNDDNFFEISVSNNCINKPDMKMIYEVGYSSKGEGRGLGLAIAKKIINNYKNVQHITDYEDNTFTQTITIEKGL